MSVGVDDGILILAVHGSPLLRFDKSDTSRSILKLSIRAVRFSPLRWSAGNQPSGHGLAFAFEVKLAPPRVTLRVSVLA
jgi:hypothetical protein